MNTVRILLFLTANYQWQLQQFDICQSDASNGYKQSQGDHTLFINHLDSGKVTVLPDLAYAVSMRSQFIHNPKEVHLQAVYRVIHYLKANLGRGILFKRNLRLILEAYKDADYAC
ncbi:uncharacterized protein LOC111308029 [Durio zibethinus]|uniref:Uncharacterized protein LOC111308029 n=1 Tax=Durio zibethinus TaxID=66656 RepID=A0A6P6ABE5_DURZI|nr:uncharacterized protein LOC111308029 [Durio zibethinus]